MTLLLRGSRGVSGSVPSGDVDWRLVVVPGWRLVAVLVLLVGRCLRLLEPELKGSQLQ